MLIYAQVEEASREKRRSKRRTVRLEGLAANERTGRQAVVAIHDLSEGGLVMQAAVPFAVAEKVGVRIADTLTVAEVIWCSDGFVGCRFTTPLSKSQLSAALLRSEHVNSADPAAELAMLLARTRMRLADLTEELTAIDRGLRVLQGRSTINGAYEVSRELHEEHEEEGARISLRVRAWLIVALAISFWVLLIWTVGLL